VYAVTQEFKDKIRAIERRTYGKIQIDYTDPFLDQSIAVSASEEAAVSYPSQTADAVVAPPHKWASLDGTWVLDGSYHLAPATAEDAVTLQMGWWGLQLAGAGGAFAAPYPVLTVTHLPRPVHSLKVVGDSARQEYPADFTINLYAQDNTLLYSKAVTGNAGASWAFALPSPVLDVAKQVLTVTKWSHVGRQVKIVEFFTSIQETYEGDNVLLVHLLEEREVSQGSLPVGNISANEIDVRLDNSSRKFDAGNTQSPLYQTLKANRRIKAWLGIKHDDESMEYVPLGTFWSGDWTAPEDEVYASTMGRDRLELFRKSTYSTSQVQVNKALYDLAVAVLQDAGLTSGEYWVDPELQDLIVPYAYFEPYSHRESLRTIAEACLGQVYCDRDGVVRVEGPSFLASKLTSDLMLTSDDYFRKDNPAKWSQIANYIEVETAPLKPDVLQEVYRSNEPVPIAAGETKTLTVYYNSPPCIEAAASLSGQPAGCSITGTTYYAWGAEVTVSSPSNAGTFTLVINAKPLKVLNKERAIAKDDPSITDNGKLKFTFPENSLLQTLSMAQTIANTLLASAKNARRDAELEWRGNPALLLGDRVTVVDRNEQNDYFVTRQEIEWTGALRAKMSGRRVT